MRHPFEHSPFVPTSRRTFLKYSLLAAGATLVSRSLFAGDELNAHREVLKQKFDLARAEGLSSKPIGDVVAAIGVSFLEAPYKAHTLEAPGPERLIVNLKEFDCVTFVESTLAIARCIKLGRYTFEEFARQLRLIRYRSGVIDGYPSRLHYFCDWIDDNERKKIVRNMAPALEGLVLEKTINFMSTHRSAYRQLKSKAVFNAIRKAEDHLNQRKHFYLPKDRIQSLREWIQDGDIVGITTTIDGLDVSHTGFAYRFMGLLRFLHAPLSGGTIQISKRSLVDYLGQEESRTGIMIARPLEPLS